MDPHGSSGAEVKENPTDDMDKKNSGSDNASETAARSIPSTSIPAVKPPTAESSPSGPVSAPSAAPMDPYAFPQDDVQDKPSVEESSLKVPPPEASARLSGVKKPSEDKTEELTANSPKPTTSKPAPLNTLSQIKLTEDFESVTTPLGSPITPDVGDIFQPSLVKSLEGSPLSVEGKPKKARLSKASTEGTTPESATKRKSSRELPAPGSPLSVVSERQQLALLRKEALESEKRSSPDTSFPRPDRSSTPSSTSSAKESREARNVNRRDGKGETPLHIASKKGDLEAVKKLVEDGADVNAADNAGWTPLHEAANHGREDVCRFLVSAGADINVKGMDDVTPLMDAVLNGHVNIAKELLTAEANPLAENNRGENCLKLAEGATKNQPELNELLRRHIGPPPVPASSSTSTLKVQQTPLKKKDKMSTPGKESPSPKKRPRQISESDSGKKLDKDAKKKLADSGGKANRPTSIDKKKKEKVNEPKEEEGLPTDDKKGPKEEEAVSTSVASKNSSPGMPAVFVGRNTLVLKPAEPVVEKEKVKENITSQYEDISDDEEAKPTEAPSLTPTQSTTMQPSQDLSAVNLSGAAPSLISPSVKESVPNQPSVQLSIPKPSFSAAKTSVEVVPPKKEVPVLSSSVPDKVDTVAELVKASSAKMSEEKPSGVTPSTESEGNKETVSLPSVDVPTKEASALLPTESTLLVPSASVDTKKAPEVTVTQKALNTPEDVVGGMKEPVKSDAIDQETEQEKSELPAKEVPSVKQPTLSLPVPATPVPPVTAETTKAATSPHAADKKSEKLDVLQVVPPTPSVSSSTPVPPISSTTPVPQPSTKTTVPPQAPPALSRPQAQVQAGLPPPPTHTTNTTTVTEKPAGVTAATHQTPSPHPTSPSLPASATSITEKPTLPSTTQLPKEVTVPSPNLSTVPSSTPNVPPITTISTTVTSSSTINPICQSTDTVLPTLPTSTSASLSTSMNSAIVPVGSGSSAGGSSVTPVVPLGVSTTVHPSPVVTTSRTPSSIFSTPRVSGSTPTNSSGDPGSITALIVNSLDGAPMISSSIRSSGPLPPIPQSGGPVTPVVRGGGPMTSIVRMPNVPTSGFVSAMSTSGTKVLFGVSTEKNQDKKVEKVKNKEAKEKETEKGKEKKKKVKEAKEGKMTGENMEKTSENQAGVSSSHRPASEDETNQAKVKSEAPAGRKRGDSATKKDRSEKPEKRLTRAQRAAAAAASGQPITPARRRNAKDDKDKPTRGRGKRAAAELDVPPGAVIDTAEQKQKRLRASPKKQLAMEAAAKSPTKKDEPVVAKEAPLQPESPSKSLGTPMDISVGSSSSEPVNRLPFKKRLTIRNEIEEFINQRRQVEENWKKYTNTFAMKVFPKNCNDYLILRKNYSIDSSMPPKRDAPPVLPLGLKTCFDEQEEERRTLMRSHLMERDRLIMGAEQEMWRLHQRFSRISAGIPIPFSACMIMSEQESNRSFQSQEQEDRAKATPTKPRMSMRDLIKWLEESDDKFDGAKTEMLTRQRLEAQMLHSKQRMYWAWRQEDLGMHDPSCRNPEDLHNPYVPQVVVEDFVMLPDA